MTSTWNTNLPFLHNFVGAQQRASLATKRGCRCSSLCGLMQYFILSWMSRNSLAKSHESYEASTYPKVAKKLVWNPFPGNRHDDSMHTFLLQEELWARWTRGEIYILFKQIDKIKKISQRLLFWNNMALTSCNMDYDIWIAVTATRALKVFQVVTSLSALLMICILFNAMATKLNSDPARAQPVDQSRRANRGHWLQHV